MKEPISRYARVGLSHHMLYSKCMVDADDHVVTFEKFLRRDDIETFDCCLPYGEERRKRLIPQVLQCGKEAVYAAHLFPLYLISLGTTSLQEQGLTRLFYRDQIEVASRMGATGFVFATGGDAPLDKRPAALAACRDFCRWFAGELAKKGIVALLEPFDRFTDKKFLLGSTEECVALIRSLEPEIDNFGIELDFAHVPLMRETFEHAVRTAAPVLKRVHLGNCVLKDPSHPLFGDKHPPMGIGGGEIDVPELTEILRLLLEIGYLNEKGRGALIIESQPFPGRSAEETATDQMGRLEAAWRGV
ncbi:MAG: TIM barrel protein [Planctomycetota bacterium]